MTSKKEFDAAGIFLHSLSEASSPSHWRLQQTILSNFNNLNAWTLLNELTQNAVDTEATAVKIKLHPDGLEFRHNGKEPLDQRSVEGLCAFSMSTKGLDSVGFMGIGFKSFIRFFHKVTIYDQGIRFAIDLKLKKNGNPDLVDLYHPQWVENCEVVDGETVFRFSNPQGDAMETLREDLENFDSIRLAVLGMRGLEKVSIDDVVYKIEKIDNGVGISLGEQPPRMFTILEEEVNMVGDAFKELILVRNVDDVGVETSTTRKVRLVKEYKLEFSEEDGKTISSIKPTKMDSGQAFCLVPLEGFTFPFKFGLDADWLLMPDRTKFHTDARHWNQQILSVIPILIRKYIQSLSKEELGVEGWAKCLDIFPDEENEHTGPLKYLDSDQFKELMKEELAEINFIRCRDGEFRNPRDTRDFPHIRTFYPRMKIPTYKQLVDECCECHILDSNAISRNTNLYLHQMSEESFLCYPHESEINIEGVKSLWDPKEPMAYLHVLDIFTEIFHEDSIIITPLANGKWAKLHDENIIFQAKPKSGSSKERALFDQLEKLIPTISSRLEVHDELMKVDANNKFKPGGKWRMGFNDGLIDFDIPEEITSIKISQNDSDLVIAIFNFSLRTEQPNLVKFILSDSGVVSCNDCFIGEPFETNVSMLKLIEGKTQSNQINSIAKSLKKMKVAAKFLIDCGVRQFKPTFHETICEDSTEASSFIGRTVSKPMMPGRWRSTWSGCKARDGTANAWTLCDYVWPLDFSEVDKIELSILLSNPPKVLRKAMSDTKIQKRGMTWYYDRKERKDPKPAKMPCKWLTDLLTTPWVKCTDGKGHEEYRIPQDAPIGSGDDPNVIRADLDGEVVDFYASINVIFGSDLQGMNPLQRIDFWKRERVIDDKLFIKTLKESGLEGEEMATVLLQSNFRTEGKIIAPLRRFISNPSNHFGGYFGFVGDLPASIKQFLNDNDVQLPDSITPPMIEGYLNSFSKRNEEDFRRNLEYIRGAYSELIDQNRLSLSELKYRTIEGKWVEHGNDELYIQLTVDSFRFKDLNEQILDLRQFPSEVESLRRIYHEEGPILLIDNQIDFDERKYVETDTVVNLTRVLMSMNNSGLDFVIRQSEDDFLDVEFGVLNLQLPYLVMDKDSIIHVYVNADTKSWAQPVAEFLGNILDASDAINNLNQALLYSNEDGFEVRYSQLCVEGKFSTTSYDVARDIVLSKVENTEQPEGGTESKPKNDRTPIIREPTTDTSDEEEGEGKDKPPSLRKKKSDMKKKAAKKLKVRKRRRGTSTQEIGDAGEEIVKEYLEINGWNVINRNEFYGKPVEGSDLVAEKDGKKRIIEVKGTESDWTGSRSISWKQAVHALQHHDPDNLYGRGHVTCWLYLVERVFDEEPKVAEIDWCRLEPEFDFPLEWKESILGEEE